jgi:2-oxoglutarate ferredoxin oxidoreductase subunit alpha
MMRRLPARGGRAIGAPDEISALSYAVGASLAGCRAMTATSGPGWALMIETVQYALMTETPVVIAVSQRLGPSTGGATQGAQGDVLLVAHATSGGYPIPVLCPVDGIDAYTLTAEAFQWAETLRTPVVLLTDKEISKTVESIDVAELPPVVTTARRGPAPDAPYLPYGIDTVDDVPRFTPVGGRLPVTTTGSAHNEHGRLRKNDPGVLRQLEHLQAKVSSRAAELERVRHVHREGADTLLVSYGVSARSCREAAASLAAGGTPVDTLEILSLFPVPGRVFRDAASRVRRVVVVEENGPGLYAQALRPHLPPDVALVQVNAVGEMIPPATVREAVRP